MKSSRSFVQLLMGLVLAFAAATAGRAQTALYLSFGASINVFNSNSGAFITQLASGVSNPWALTIDNTGKLYTTLYTGGNVAEYDTKNNTLVSSALTTLGMSFPTGLALQGNNLFVASQGSQRISQYDATTGSLINANFITNVYNPTAMVIDAAGRLYVTNNGGSVSVYSAATGGAINTNFITGLVTPMGLALDNAGRLYVSATNGNTVSVYDSLTGTLLNSSLIAGLVNPRALTFDASGNLYVSSYDNNTSSFIVGKYNPLTGAAINANLVAVGSSIGGLGFVPAAVPEPATYAVIFGFLALGLAGWRRGFPRRT